MRSVELFLRAKEPRARALLGPVLGTDTRRYLADGFLETRWYPVETFVELVEATDAVLGDDDGQTARELGRFAGERALTVTHRLLFKFGDTRWLIDRAATAWREHFDEGSMEVVERVPGRAILLSLEGVDLGSRAVCMAIQGWMERAAELAGEDRVHGEHRCRAAGDTVCQWRFAYKGA